MLYYRKKETCPICGTNIDPAISPRRFHPEVQMEAIMVPPGDYLFLKEFYRMHSPQSSPRGTSPTAAMFGLQ